MTYQDAIEHTKNKKGIKVSFGGLISRVTRKRGALNKGEKFVLDEMSKHYKLARAAWLNDDLEIVAEFFGLYVD